MTKIKFTKKTIIWSYEWKLHITDDPKYDHIFKPETRLFAKMNYSKI